MLHIVMGAMRKTKRGARKQVRVVEVQEEAALTPNSEGEKELAIPRAGDIIPAKGTGPEARKSLSCPGAFEVSRTEERSAR